LPEESHPTSEIHGRTSKIERYYWREIYFETTKQFADWADNHNYTDYQLARKENPDARKAIEKHVLEVIKELHKHSPKYVYREKSSDDIFKENRIEVVKLDGIYIPHSTRGVRILQMGKEYSAEEFASLYYMRQGYETIFMESTPLHTIFAIFLWLLIQDPTDPLVKIIGFGDRTAYDSGRKGEIIWTHLPQDFGTSGYAIRRADAIAKHFAMLPHERSEFLWVFDYWIEPSFGLRQYLWAHSPEDIDKARKLVTILPTDVIQQVLRYLVTDYWRRYLGWPDLLVYKPNDYFFIEVKSSKDKLRENQKQWIEGNTAELHLPFKLVKIHKKVG
jgi:VRR-NUC domain